MMKEKENPKAKGRNWCGGAERSEMAGLLTSCEARGMEMRWAGDLSRSERKTGLRAERRRGIYHILFCASEKARVQSVDNSSYLLAISVSESLSSYCAPEQTIGVLSRTPVN
jgi:hypothetical protein